MDRSEEEVKEKASDLYWRDDRIHIFDSRKVKPHPSIPGAYVVECRIAIYSWDFKKKACE